MKFRGAAWQHLVSPIRFANGWAYSNDIPTVIQSSKSRDGAKALHFVLLGTLARLRRGLLT